MKIFIAILLVLVCIFALVSISKPTHNWSLYVQDVNEMNFKGKGYENLQSCWDAAVIYSNRGEKFFECRLNCSSFNKESCEYICPQNALFSCQNDTHEPSTKY